MAESVAIVGMALRLPGAEDEHALWRLLSNGESALSEIPEDRWKTADFYHEDRRKPGRTVMRRGGFLDRIDGFDERFFGISPREARSMDPQQRMLLEETWHCLENAGIRPSDTAGCKVGVFAGVMATDYQQNLTAAGVVPDAFSALGTYDALLANRLSHFFAWTGPSFTIDAACASSLVALHEARRALIHGDCEMAVVAAANALINPWRSISFSQAGMLSEDGECKTFDAGANGYVQGEGAVVMLLMKRGDCARWGLRERALVLGGAVNHVGPSRGVTAPSVASQRAVIEAALADAGVAAHSITYVEAHGTGTALGDPIEAAALASVFGTGSGDAATGGSETGPACAVGSIKTNIGHLEAAAGLAGTAKVVLMMEHGWLAPTRNIRTINPMIDFETGPLRAVRMGRAWTGRRLRAGVSSFGFGGANAHVILEATAPRSRTAAQGAMSRASSPPSARGREKVPPGPFLLSARSPEALSRLVTALKTHAREAERGGFDLVGFRDTVTRRREVFDYRHGAVVANWRDVHATLDAFDPETRRRSGPPAPPQVAVRLGRLDEVTPARWESMERALPAFAEAVREATLAAQSAGIRKSPRLTALARAHALGAVLVRAGVTPALLHGEGLGRWAALTVSGVIGIADAIRATGEGKAPTPKVSRPRFPIHDPVNDRILAPWREPPGYAAALAADAAAEPLDHDAVTALGRAMWESNRTFRAFLAEWSDAFRMAGLDRPDAVLNAGAQAGDAAAARLLALAIVVSWRRCHDRWAIPETGFVPPEALDEFSSLIADGALSVTAAAKLVGAIAGDHTPEPLLLDPTALRTLEPAARYPRLAALTDELTEVGDPPAWLRNRLGRPKHPPRIDADFCIDIGAVRAPADGTPLKLQLNRGLFASLQKLLCHLWLSGAAIDWSVLGAPAPPERLPGYPFERRRHWIDLPRPAADVSAPMTVPTMPLLESTADPIPLHQWHWTRISPSAAPSDAPLLLLAGRSEVARHLTGNLAGIERLDGSPDGDAAADRIEALSAPTVFVAWPLDHGGTVPDPDATRHLENECLLPLLTLMRRLVLTARPVNLIVLGAGVKDPARTGGLLYTPALAAASALVRSAAMESQHLAAAAIALDGGGPALADLPAAATRPGPVGELAIDDDGVWVRHLQPTPAKDATDQATSAGAPLLQAEGASLLVGGFGGIGAALCRHLSKAGRQGLAVIGRRPESEVLPVLKSLNDAGAAPIYVQADATDRAAVDAALERIEANLGPITEVIHGEMVLNDASVTRLTEADFHRAFAPKALGYAVLDQAFRARRGEADLPRRVVLGSVLATIANAGQANYTAGSAYQQALAEIAATDGADIKVIGWGAWGRIGRVGDPKHGAALSRIGLVPIGEAEGLAAYAAACRHPDTNVVAAHLDGARTEALMSLEPVPTPEQSGAEPDALTSIDRLARARLREAIAAAGWDVQDLDPAAIGLAASQERLHAAIGDILERHPDHGETEADGLSKRLRTDFPDHAGIIELVDRAVPRIPDVLRGSMPGTQVMFPGGTMDLVGGFYAGNPLADGANALVADQVSAAVATLADTATPDTPVRILEVGAGTGATTAPVLDALDRQAGALRYTFTDLSAAFQKRARARFGANRPWFSVESFDFDAEPEAHGSLGAFDIIIAANAVHVTRDIASMLERLRARLAPGGRLILNELVRPMDFLTLTFGLLDGWWLAEDARRGGGPLLTTHGWRSALRDHFEVEFLDGPGADGSPTQAVIVARDRRTAPSPTPTLAASASDALTHRVLDIVAEVVETDRARLDTEVRLDDLGIDSILSLDLIDRLFEETGIRLDPSAVLDHPTTALLARHLAMQGATAARPVETEAPPSPILPVQPAPASETPSTPMPSKASPVPSATAAPVRNRREPARGDKRVAIIGMAARLPGGNSLAAFARAATAAGTVLRTVPDGRWSMADLAFWPGAGRLDGMTGGFLDHAEWFDPTVFGLSPREALLMDPQQRLLLEETWSALADAGRPQDIDANRRAMGVFVGASAGDYGQKLEIAGHSTEPQSLSSLLPSSMAARIANVFGLEGPAMTLDLACASGLAALHQAVGAMAQGRCESAVVAGVNLFATPQFPLRVEAAGLLSRTGAPRPFDADSDGIVLGEAAVALVLKPLTAAEADGDRIHAVIEGTALSQAGGGAGLSAPDAEAQARAMRDAMADAGTDADGIQVVEAHGVGSAAGDAAEAEALRAVFADVSGPTRQIDCLKPLTGHLLAASGLAVVARLGLRYGTQSPIAGLDTTGEGLAPFAPAGAADGATLSARTLVNCFSLNGACAAAVIVPPGRSGITDGGSSPTVIAIGATLKADLIDRLAALRDWLAVERPTLHDVAAVLGWPRPTDRWRAAFAARDVDGLVGQISAALAGGQASGEWRLGQVAPDGSAAAPANAAPEDLMQAIVDGAEPAAIGIKFRSSQPTAPVGFPFARKRFWPEPSPSPGTLLDSRRPSPPRAPTATVATDAPNRADALASIARVFDMPEQDLEPGAVLIDLGADSILAVEIRERLGREAGLVVSMSDILSRRPIGEIIDTAPTATESDDGIEIIPDPARRFEPFGVTDLQFAYLLGRSPAVPLGGTGCHVYWEFLAPAPIDVGRLQAAWERLIETHDMLRAVFTEDGRQQVLERVEPRPIASHDWTALPDAEADAAHEALRDRMAREVFDPGRWPLFAIEVSHRGGRSRLHFSIDLLIIDVLSLFRLLGQWSTLYQRPDSNLARPEISFRDYVGYLESRRDGVEQQRALAFWQPMIESLPNGPELPRARANTDLTGAPFSRRKGRLRPEEWTRLKQRARAAGLTPVGVLLGAMAATLSRWSRSDTFALNLTVYDRRRVHDEIDAVIGDFTSTVLLAMSGDRETGFLERARAIGQDLARCLDHTAVSGVEAARRFAKDKWRDADNPPSAYVFTSMLGYEPVIGDGSLENGIGRLDWGVTQTPQVLLDAQV